MMCADCHENQATVHFTQIVNDETETFHLCQLCAESRGLKSSSGTSPAPLSDFLSEMGAPIFTSATTANAACPRCGCTFRQFRKTGRLGCGRCYTTFEREMGALLRKIHGSSDHIGIIEPERSGARNERVNQLAGLRRELRRAVDKEEYERAAELRDAILSMERNGNDGVDFGGGGA